MAKKTYQDTDRTSFDGVTFNATLNQLIKVFGAPSYKNNTGEDKVNFEWEMETDEGSVFTIYDWKEYRILNEDYRIEWHIGSRSRSVASDAQYEVLRELGNLVE